METKKRSSFTGKIGFVLAAAGSAVGLGNIWRFPYVTAQNGGGIFLLAYVILALTFGFALMTTEISLGRKTGQSAIGAFRTLNRKFSFLGYLESLVPIIIFPYYSVIGGWVIKYLIAFCSGNAAAAAGDEYFGGFISSTTEPILWFVLFIVVTGIVVLFGVEKGIERVSKFMMPVLVILTIGIAVYVCFQPGAVDGIIYFLKPDFSRFTVNTVLQAMGQLFYSMSLSMGIMITYGSYMKKEVGIQSSVIQIEAFDSMIAVFAGLMVIPAVFAFGGGEAGLNQGPGLMFGTLPKVFQSMPGGVAIGVLFFLLVMFAALTSSISLMEAVVSIVQDKFKTKRNTTCIAVLLISILIGLLSCLGYSAWSDVTIFGMQFLDFFDFISNSVIMPIVALLTCVFVGYVIKPKAIIEECEETTRFKFTAMFKFVIKFFAPICIILILITSILPVLGIELF